ncbi:MULTISPECIES: preprotein translocase subunit SecY [unclassified Neochlamydia]|uniref:preprotein translocase subunit SecY n=1 Tax=unclassified Neochlamydia TaxID=2643326 RepID=UPI00140C8400|nr:MULTISPECIES: preprotein translocase subunit SecY [unclassified Neochlamydia]MBS4165557.1 Protein translocase subunit SecY [Neochlamydia sp. AcF65]MBS4169606.1 Protein translocase subunit SecY [Neochlamydia sp. AcF95]NGY94438.1 Protein translocase subunit SecY [Neochlamydia sp. AcF84]
MFKELQKVFQIPELRAKILFTILMLAVYRVGGFIPVPGINGEVAVSFFRHATGGGQNLFQLVDIFSGGAFSQMTVIALGVMPYISASIIMQLVVALWPSLQREIKENAEQGRRKINKYTRGLTIILSILQSAMFAKYAIQMNYSRPGIITGELLDAQIWGMPILFYLLFIFTMTAGTVLLMWIGEQITERGIGNGMSLIITVGIVSQLPTAIGLIIQQLNLNSQEPGAMNFTTVLVLIAIFVVVALGTILVIQGHRRIPLQYARRVVGRKEVQGGNSYIPLKVNYAGVIPVIFASSLLMFPAIIATFAGAGNRLSEIAQWLSPGSTLYILLFVVLIIFFTYFWTATQFRPDQIASDMKKNGAFIPGIRQGKPTQDYLESTMNKITLIGAISLAMIAVLPTIIGRLLGVPATISYFFGGTALLILVGVVLDTMKQIESHLLMKRYEGFMKKGRIRGRG